MPVHSGASCASADCGCSLALATPRSRHGVCRWRGRHPWRLAGALLLASLALAGCDDDPAAAEPAVVRVTTTDHRFDAPGELPAGATRLVVENEGAEAHHAQLLRLDDTATPDDLDAALATGEPPALLEIGAFVGGTALVAPDSTSRADAVVDLDPGSYALLCFVPDATGVPHVARGMVRPFEVVDGDDAPEPPEADAEVALADYRFDLPDTLDGDDTVDVANTAEQEAHELVLAALADGVDAADVTEALDAGQPPPALPVGGMQALVPGTTEQLRLDLAPGRYAVFCAVPSPDGTPHYRLGMVDEVTIR